MKACKGIVLNHGDLVVGQWKPKEIDEFDENTRRNLFQLIVRHRQHVQGRLSRERLTMEILQPILIQVQRLEVARVPHHDVFQFHHPIARDVEVSEVGKAAEGLRLDFCQLVVLQ